MSKYSELRGQRSITDVSEKVSRRMRAIKSRATTPELRLAKAFRKAKVRYRSQVKRAGINVDFFLPDSRVVIFVDGCFWHGCKRHRALPKDASEFWHTKIRKNRSRDRRNNRTLREVSYIVIRVWEHDVKADPDLTVERILRDVRSIANQRQKLVVKNFRRRLS